MHKVDRIDLLPPILKQPSFAWHEVCAGPLEYTGFYNQYTMVTIPNRRLHMAKGCQPQGKPQPALRNRDSRYISRVSAVSFTEKQTGHDVSRSERAVACRQ